MGIGVIGPAQILAGAVTASKLGIGHPIVMFEGQISDLPAGWYFCDGTNGTPDLRDKCIVAAKQDDGGTAKTNVEGSLKKSGGEATHILTIPEMPSHSHTLNGQIISSSGDLQAGSNYGKNTGSANNTGGGGAHNNVQPYYALAFAMLA